jgi:hypothetical protein
MKKKKALEIKLRKNFNRINRFLNKKVIFTWVMLFQKEIEKKNKILWVWKKIFFLLQLL